MDLYFSISEFIKSDKAILNNINNMPDINSLDNLLNLIYFCLQPIRYYIKKPIIITSGFRCHKLNSLINGKCNSQHTIGQAADFYIKGISVCETIKLILKSGVEFDQLINEYDRWVHISYARNKNRHQVLKY